MSAPQQSIKGGHRRIFGIRRLNVQDLGGANCSPTCTVTIPSTGSGNLLVLVDASAAIGEHFSTVTGAGSWVAAGACHATNTSPGDDTDIAYNLSSSSGVTSLSITLSSNDISTDLAYAEYTGEPFTLDGTCQTTNNGVATTTPQSPAITTTGARDVVVVGMTVNDSICAASAVTNVQGGGWPSPATLIFPSGQGDAYEDNINAPAATYQVQFAQVSGGCPGSPASVTFSSSVLAFK